MCSSDLGIATYSGGSGTGNLTFVYTVGASDSTTSALAIAGFNVPGNAAIVDGSGNAASLAGAELTFPSLKVDATPVQTPTFGKSTANADGTFTLNGTAGANTTLIIYDNGYVQGTAAVNASGNWTYTSPTMANNVWVGFSAAEIGRAHV